MKKEELRKFYGLSKEADQIRDKIEELKALRRSCGGGLDGMPRTPGTHSKVEDIVIRIDEAERIYQAKIADMIALQIRIEEAMEELPAPERKLIRYRYLDGMTWEEVCVRLGYGWSQTHRLHAKALGLLSESSRRDFIPPLTPPCVPFGTRRFNSKLNMYLLVIIENAD